MCVLPIYLKIFNEKQVHEFIFWAIKTSFGSVNPYFLLVLNLLCFMTTLSMMYDTANKDSRHC